MFLTLRRFLNATTLPSLPGTRVQFTSSTNGPLIIACDVTVIRMIPLAVSPVVLVAEIADLRMQGLVAIINVTREFGFITPDVGGEHSFFHLSDTAAQLIPPVGNEFMLLITH